MDFKLSDYLKSGIVVKLGIDLTRNPAHLISSSQKKTRVQFVDLPKKCCELRLFSAPRQRMSVVEGRDVIVN